MLTLLSVRRYADEVRPGDEVQVADGTYHEVLDVITGRHVVHLLTCEGWHVTHYPRTKIRVRRG